MAIDGQCPKCRSTVGLVYLHKWRLHQISRLLTSKEVNRIADIGLGPFEWEVGEVSESGRTVREIEPRCFALFGCSACKRAWWTRQPALLSLAVDAENMKAPDGMEYRSNAA